MSNKLEEAGISWVILGAQTKPTVMPKIEWVQEIVEAADKAGIPVFLKDSLKQLMLTDLFNVPKWAFKKHHLRQEMPE